MRTSWTDNFPAWPERPHKLFDELTFDGLEKNQIASVRRIADMTKIPSAIVISILTNRLGSVSRQCRFVPHVLTEPLWEDRPIRPIELLPILSRAEQTNWHLILTGDESWFFCYPANSRIWLPPDAEKPEVARRLINTPKIMVTLF
jgi:hypothetical protein